MGFEMIDAPAEQLGTVIKVIGVGGAGGNAVAHMISRNVQGVDFLAANTDAQALARIPGASTIQLGKTGLGAGAKPEAGRMAAEEARERIREQLQGANMVFITAGMGGGTGTGAAPVVAAVAKDMGILTVAVVTKPFEFEGGKRLRTAEAGLEDLASNVDSLIVVLNEKLQEVLGDDATMESAFKTADDVLHNAVSGIAEIITVPGLVNVDFEDVKTVMREQGKAMMGIGQASGTDRARVAAEQAVASPLLEGVDLSGASGVLVNITASKGTLKLRETSEAVNTVRNFAAKDAEIIFGTVWDDNLGDAMRVTVVATGLGRAAAVAKPMVLVNNERGLRTGTDNLAVAAMTGGTTGTAPAGRGADYSNYDMPSIWRDPRSAAARVSALEENGMDRLDIPAFLRKQAD
ncbi:cell division protein FtsZ [Derxia gummosa]|uniref:Cell division protein FtsZ n=1 Tax=Derxia gummosa DSM 723 TaxID=1121388 RepID=A0A8B6X2B7_9BURK|nr:cell division protein FtsZ [Derxia gummosa]